MRRRLTILPLLVLAAACGGTASTTNTVADAAVGPAPGEMCTAPATPIVAAYDRETGAFQWVACEPGGGMFMAEAASDDVVWVKGIATGPIAFDARTGEELGRKLDSGATEIPADADRRVTSAPAVDGVQLRGGQDDPLSGTDVSTGESWTRVGFVAYDDVWAAGDGAVFVRVWDPTGQDPGTWITAYNVADGSVRWQVDGSTGYGWPWHVEGQQVFIQWWNLEVRSTVDGSLAWATEYPEPVTGYPRMFGVVVNDDTVFVSFTSIASGGD